MSLIKLFFIFVKIGAILLGGGYVILPIMTNEFCGKRNLLKKEEVVDYFTLSQSLPGIIAANMAIFVGYKLRGIFGALAGICGITFIPFWSIVILASLLNSFADNIFVQAALWGVGIAVIALILLSVSEIWQNSKKNTFFYIIFCLSLLSIIICKLSPLQTIIVCMIIGILIKSCGRGKI